MQFTQLAGEKTEMPSGGVLNFDRGSHSRDDDRNFQWRFSDDSFPYAVADRIVAAIKPRRTPTNRRPTKESRDRQVCRKSRGAQESEKAAASMAEEQLRKNNGEGFGEVRNRAALIENYERGLTGRHKVEYRKHQPSMDDACRFIPHGKTEPRLLPRGTVVGCSFAINEQFRGKRRVKTFLVYVRRADASELVAVRGNNIWRCD